MNLIEQMDQMINELMEPTEIDQISREMSQFSIMICQPVEQERPPQTQRRKSSASTSTSSPMSPNSVRKSSSYWNSVFHIA